MSDEKQGNIKRPPALRLKNGDSSYCSCVYINDINTQYCSECAIKRGAEESDVAEIDKDPLEGDTVVVVSSIFEGDIVFGLTPNEEPQPTPPNETCECDAIMKFEGICIACIPMQTGLPKPLKRIECFCDSMEIVGLDRRCDYCVSLGK